MSGWIGVDLDGTLACYDGWRNGEIGEPIPAMLFRVKKWLAEGKDVRIFTARVGEFKGMDETIPGFIEEQRRLIDEWCLKHVGRVLPVTAMKDFACVEIWDDRAIQIEANTGRRMDGKRG